MVNVDSSLDQINAYMRKPITLDQLEEALSRLGFELTENNPKWMKMDITADRPDMISTAGIARVLNAYLGYTKGLPPIEKKPSDYRVLVEKSVHPVRPFTAAMVVRNLPLTPERLEELIWVQEKIHATFARERKKAAIGIYPLRKIAWPISFVGLPPHDILFAPLGEEKSQRGSDILVNHPTGKKYAHLLKDFPVYPVFRDAKGKILSMPPIINSQHAGQVTPEDRDLFVEVSGHYWPTVSVILDILAHLFTDMKGDIHEVQIHFFNEQQPRVTPELATRLVPLEIDVVNRTLGTSFTSEQVSQLLGRMLYGVPKMNPKQVVVEVPSFRVDVLHPLDLVDDVARAYGFDNLSPMEVALSTRGGILPQTQLNADIRLALVGMGFQEVMTGILTAHAHHFTSFDREESPHITLGVVKEKGLSMVRNMLYPETMRALLANRSKRLPFRLFELDQVVVPDSHTETGTRTVYKLCTLSGHASASFEEMKGMVEALAQVLGEKPVFAPMGNPTFIPGRSATVTMGHRSGFMGELHPRILERLSIPFPIVLFEMNVD